MTSWRRISSVAARAALIVLLAAGFAGQPGIAPAAAQDPGFDVRGRWEWRWAQDACDGPCRPFVAYLTIKRQDPVTGALAGTYQVGPRRPVAVTGTVAADRMTVRLGRGDSQPPVTGTLLLEGGKLTFDATMSATSSTVHGILVEPVARSSSEGGTRPSATLATCYRDMSVAPDQAVLQCTALVTDASGQPDSRTPTGTVTWKAKVGRVQPGTCALSAPAIGGTASCTTMLTGTDTEIPIGADVPITASYAGNATYGPSEGSPRWYGPADSLDESDLYGPTCNPATTPKPNVGCGDPVNPATGNLSLAVVDIAIAGRGPTLGVSRTYNAQAAAAGTSGRFGTGWSDEDSARIELGPGKSVTVHLGSGATVPFTAKGKRFTSPSWVTATLARGPEQTYVLSFADRRTLSFDRDGRLVAVSDRSEEPITLAYAADGTLASVTDASGRSLVFTSDAAGHVTAAVDPAGRTVGYAYDPAGDLVSVTDVGGGVTRYAYDDRHRLVSITDPTGAVTTNRYDEQDRVVEQADPLGRTLTFAYAGSFPDLVAIATDGNGNRSAYQYRAGVMTSETSGLDGDAPATTIHVYDDHAALVVTVDANGQPWRMTRDAAGNILSSTDPLGRTTTARWSKGNDLVELVSPLGITTRLTYDDHGLPIGIVRAAGSPDEAVTTIARDAAHPADITSVTDPLGAVTTFTYDEQGDVVRVVDALGEARAVTRDVLGWIGDLTDPLGAVTTLTHDAFGGVLTVTDPLAATTSLTRDADRRLASATDALGQTTAIERDPAGRVTGLVLPDGTALGTGHDGVGDVTSQTSGDGTVSTLANDELRRPVTWTDALGHAWRLTWDTAGDLVTSTDPSGQVTRYSWDAAGQLMAIDHAGVTPDVTFTYDADGRRTSMTDGTGTSTYAWDALGRLVSVTDGAGRTVASTYDAASRVTSITYPDGRVVEQEHDALGRLVAVRDGSGHESTFAWDAAGRLVRTTTGDGSINERTYDARGGLLGITVTPARPDAPLLSVNYGRDPLGRVETQTDSLAGGTVTATRDARGRLTTLGDESFAVDAAGNLTRLRGQTLTYDAAGRLLSADGPSGTTTYRTDAAGRRTAATSGTGGPTAFTWDSAGRLVSAGDSSFAYDGDGLRTDAAWADGATGAFSWLRSAGLPQLLGDGSSWFIRGPGGLPLEEIRADGTIAWFHLDQAGSVRTLTDEAGTVIATFTWDAYGQLAARTGDAQTRIGYQGHYTDPDTGLQVLGARTYDPATGQFLSVDPLVLSTRQPYAFADRDPLTFGDPSGTASSIFDLIGGGGMGSAEMLDRLGYSSDLAGAVCEQLDSAIGDVSQVLSDLRTAFVGSTPSPGGGLLDPSLALLDPDLAWADALLQGHGRAYAAVVRAQARQQRDLAQAVQRLERGMEALEPMMREISDSLAPFVMDFANNYTVTLEAALARALGLTR